MTDRAGASPVRLARLDGLRGVAACVVACYHARLLFAPEATAAAWPRLGLLFDWGWTFVDLFFVISGTIFAHAYGRPGQLGSGAALAEFAVARVARLYPLHLVTLLAAAFLFAGKPGSDPMAFLAHLLMLQGLVQPFADTFDGPSWSLTVECLCYGLFALAACAGRRALLLVTGLGIGWGALNLAVHGLPGGPWVNDVFPRGLLGFFAGQALWQGRAWLARVPTGVLVMVVAGGLVFAAQPISPLLGLGLLAWPAVVLLGQRLPLLESRPALWLGDRSYAIYLIHMPVIEWLATRAGSFAGSRPWLIVVALGVALFIGLLADAALRWIERPARAFIREAWRRRAAPLARA